ncbi:MAG: glutamine synthetase [Eubacterium sp.]|jgi:glutamine synthetase|nr:glutamine synthetase [Eubacterium sp.]MCI2196818.1 glutamine synthetase [Eubacterium sp.]
MFAFDTEKMLFTITPDQHTTEKVTEILQAHPEVEYVSMVGIDIGGHDTDEKIPVSLFLKDMDDMLENGVQTDGSSVVLPKIADLGNAKVCIIPDKSVNWYVDYNYRNICHSVGDLPVGTLRIPCFLIHNDDFYCGSRSILKKAVSYFKQQVMEEIKAHPYVLNYIDGVNSPDDIDHLTITSATELEFWVKTPDDKGDREQLFTAQVLKEQYWKRTYGDVRTALEETLRILDHYGFKIEMGHKEVGGVKAQMGNTGHYDHVMEQLEIDWRFTDALQAADNENQIKYVVRDIFTQHGLDVTFMAKPFEGVAGSGEHTHIGLAATLKNGKTVSLFAPADMKKDFMSPIGFGALMGVLKNYEVLNPFISASNDALNRLKPGYEAPVCIVTSLGKSVEEPSRNRTVLVGLIRDAKKPLATRFELRAPNPKSNTYLVLAASYLACIDGIHAALDLEKTPDELEKSLSKSYGEEDFYLEKNREYRSEEDVFENFTEEERNRLFGKAPATVWQNLKAFDLYPDKMKIYKNNDIFPDLIIESYRAAILAQWKTELHDRLIPSVMEYVRGCKRLHNYDDFTDYDVKNWNEIDALRHELAKDTITDKALLSRTKQALDDGLYDVASDLQLEVKAKKEKLTQLYENYKKNLL